MHALAPDLTASPPAKRPRGRPRTRDTLSVQQERAMYMLFAVPQRHERLAAVLRAHPELATDGFKGDPRATPVRLEDVEATLEWMLYTDETRVIRLGMRTTTIKAQCETWRRETQPGTNPYTRHGAVIAALLVADYPLVRRNWYAAVTLTNSRRRLATGSDLLHGARLTSERPVPEGKPDEPAEK